MIASLAEDISEYRSNAFMELGDGSYIYYDDGAEYAIEEICKTLTHLDNCVKYIDEHYSDSKNAIDDKIEEVTNYSCKTWEEYRKRLNTNYHMDEGLTNLERAEKIVFWYVEFMTE